MNRTNWRKRTLCAAFLTLLLILCTAAAAESDDNLDVFDDPFMQEYSLLDASGLRLYVQDMDWDGDACYAYLTDMCIYTYTPGGEPERLCTLPSAPENLYARVDGLTDEDLEQLYNTVTYISVWDGALYGYNVYSGRWGVIDGEGIHWEESRLNFSCLFHEDSFFPDRIAYSFMTDEALYVLADSPNEQGEYVYALFAFDLWDGTSERYDYDGLLGAASRYEEPDGSQQLMLLYYDERLDDPYNGVFFYLDDRSFSAGSLRLDFLKEGDESLGGLAYNSQTGEYYLAANGALYATGTRGDGSQFREIAVLNTSYVTPETHGWALSGGRYAILSDGLHIRTGGGQLDKELQIATVASITELELYQQEHPEVRLSTGSGMDQQTVIDYLLTGDNTVDIYSMPLNYVLTLLKEKGMAASMSGSEIIEADVSRMDEAVQAALRDAEGHILAYPAGDRVSLMNYRIHEGYWRMVFGDKPLPTTFEEVLDAWIEWEENDLVEQYPMLGFTLAEGFSYEGWVRRFVTTYIRQHDAQGTPDLYAPELRTVLEKLANLAKVRQQHGRGIRGESDGDRTISTESGDCAYIFNPSEQIAMDAESEWEGARVYDQDINDVTWLPLTFEKDAQQYTDASMDVYIINPYSWHQAEAIAFIECMTNPRAISRVYYALHPDANEPLEKEGYEAQRAWYESRCEEYRAGIETAKAQDGDTEELERQLRNYENWLASDEGRWEISANNISTYRAMIAEHPLNLHMSSPYLYAMTLGESNFVNTLCAQYAQGDMPIDLFLQKLSGRLSMIALEDSGSAGAG